jgi:hypothetical protein
LCKRGQEINRPSQSAVISSSEYEQIRRIIDLDPLAEMEEQDMALIWKAR